MDLKERYTNKANDLLGLLYESEVDAEEETLPATEGEPEVGEERYEDEESAKLDFHVGTLMKDYGVESVLGAVLNTLQDVDPAMYKVIHNAVGPLAEEEIEPDRAVDYKYHQDYFQKNVRDFGMTGPEAELAWAVWQKAIDTERRLKKS
jgi:hypothetical protein